MQTEQDTSIEQRIVEAGERLLGAPMCHSFENVPFDQRDRVRQFWAWWNTHQAEMSKRWPAVLREAAPRAVAMLGRRGRGEDPRVTAIGLLQSFIRSLFCDFVGRPQQWTAAVRVRTELVGEGIVFRQGNPAEMN